MGLLKQNKMLIKKDNDNVSPFLDEAKAFGGPGDLGRWLLPNRPRTRVGKAMKIK